MNPVSITRKRVLRRIVGQGRLGPIYLLRITYTDGRKTWNISGDGCLTLCGNDKALVRRLLS